MLGRVLQRQIVNTTPNNQQIIQLDVSSYPAGTYTVYWVEGQQSKLFLK